MALAVAQSESSTWPSWRGENRDARTASLPKKWNPPQLIWQASLPGPTVGGIAANEEYVLVSSRDDSKKLDVFTCIDAFSGAPLWNYSYRSSVELDYGNSPRATPCIHDALAILLGAGGELHCVDIDTGKLLWKKDFRKDLEGELPVWGYAASPLIIDNQVIVQPGGTAAGLVSLDIHSGEVNWKCKTEQTGYAAPVVAMWNGIQQIVTFDRKSLFSFSVKGGEILTKVDLSKDHEFHVPTPLVMNDGIVTLGEIAGTRRFQINQHGKLNPQPDAQQLELASDMQSPVANESWVLGVNKELIALNCETLSVEWRIEDPIFEKFCSLIHDGATLIAINQESRMIQIDITNTNKEFDLHPERRIQGRMSLESKETNSFAHPAVVGSILYVQTSDSLKAWQLQND